MPSPQKFQKSPRSSHQNSSNGKKKRSNKKKEKRTMREEMDDSEWAYESSKRRQSIQDEMDAENQDHGADASLRFVRESGDDDHDDDDHGDDSDGSDEDDDDSEQNGTEDDDYEDSEADERMQPSPIRLVRTVSVKRKETIDQALEDLIGDDEEELDEILARVKVLKAKRHADNLFKISDEGFMELNERIQESFVFTIKQEVWNLVTKGPNLLKRRELLRDKVAQHECLDQFFEKNDISHRLRDIISSAAKKTMEFVEDPERIREETFGNFVKSGGNFRETPRKAKLDASKRGTGERRSSSREPKRRLDDEEFTSLSPVQVDQMKRKERRDYHEARQPGQPFKKQSKNKKRRMEQ